jgi:hypothetical protein
VLTAAASPALAVFVYAYDGPDLPIPADVSSTKGPMDDAIIDVTDHLTVADLNVALDITHTSALDLEIMLQGPGGQQILLNACYDTNDFFKAANYTDTIFDDEAAEAIEQAQPPFTGSFRPVSGNYLSEFDGTDAFGTWRLKVNDLRFDDSGYLENFELIITVPEPATLAFFSLAALLMRRRN